MMDSYQRFVYAGVLGKVIGVYMGRPFEGWLKSAIEKTFGQIDRYVAPERNVPIVVSDDDISGTLTFIRALEDSGLYENTPDEFFGDTWLNYLIENKTILWWGGMGMSTEHTAYLRLKHGIKSPQSGSIACNGKIVAEQIGAQIFIDAYGLVCPGNPELAAKLARKSASVSHDGEAVNGAIVVATMIAAAYTVKNMEQLLDIGVSFIPQDSIIAQVHRDVRAWCREDKNWHATYSRIVEKYGYRLYGGNCHIVPNHALMVMAWSYAQDNFLKAQIIVNTCGYDTDCNAANVGSVMGVLVGLEHICDDYDFRTPIADKIILPTADGTNSCTDCWLEARRIINIGRAIAKQPLLPTDDWFTFDAPGAVHGFTPEAGDCTVTNPDGNGLRIVCKLADGKPVTLCAPVATDVSYTGGYSIVGTPKLVSGTHLTAFFDSTSATEIKLFVDVSVQEGAQRLFSAPGCDGQVDFIIPDTNGAPVVQLGFEISGPTDDTVTIAKIVAFGSFIYHTNLLKQYRLTVPGWLHGMDFIHGAFSDDHEPLLHFGKNDGTAVAVTGNRWWTNTVFEARIAVHLADDAGIICGYQGLQKYYSLTRRGDSIVLARHNYGETILAQAPCDWQYNDVHLLKLDASKPSRLMAWFDGTRLFDCPLSNDDKLYGACGIVVTTGNLGMGALTVTGDIHPKL